jgi:hypothetical protein
MLARLAAVRECLRPFKCLTERFCPGRSHSQIGRVLAVDETKLHWWPVRQSFLLAAFYRSIAMETFFKVAGSIVAAVLGLLVWNVFPEAEPIITGGIAAAFVCYVFSILVKVTVKQLIGDELIELRLQSNATADRLNVLDRKVTAILRDALERREAANLRDAVRTPPKQGHVVQRRSA